MQKPSKSIIFFFFQKEIQMVKKGKPSADQSKKAQN